MKNFLLILLGIMAVSGFSVVGASAQTTPKIVSGGIVNGKALSLPKPEYPQELRDAGIEGVAAVNIVIDESGSVIAAEAELNDQRVRKAEDGTVMEPMVLDAQLRGAAEAAARGARFAPTLLANSPVQVKGKVVYNFSASAGGGVLNGKASAMPMPEYPAAARAVNAGGPVSVQITIDEGGNVISAAAVSGHPLLRRAAEAAAPRAKFSPTTLTGTAVKVSGILTYNFVP